MHGGFIFNIYNKLIFVVFETNEKNSAINFSKHSQRFRGFYSMIVAQF